MGRFSTEFLAASREAVGEGPETKTWARTVGARRKGSSRNVAARAVVVMARPGVKVEGDSTAGGGGARKKSAGKRNGDGWGGRLRGVSKCRRAGRYRRESRYLLKSKMLFWGGAAGAGAGAGSEGNHGALPCG